MFLILKVGKIKLKIQFKIIFGDIVRLLNFSYTEILAIFADLNSHITFTTIDKGPGSKQCPG